MAIRLRGPECEVVSDRPRVCARDLERNRVPSQFDGQFVSKIDRLKERLELVKTIRSTLEHAQQEVHLGRRTNRDCLSHDALAVRTSPSDSPIFQA